MRILGVVFAWSGAAFAQAPPNNHVALTLTAGARATTTDFSQSITFEAFSEQGSITSNYTITHRPVVDGSITVRIWRGFGAAVAGTVPSRLIPRTCDRARSSSTGLQPAAHDHVATQASTIGSRPPIYRQSIGFKQDIDSTCSCPVVRP